MKFRKSRKMIVAVLAGPMVMLGVLSTGGTVSAAKAKPVNNTGNIAVPSYQYNSGKANTPKPKPLKTHTTVTVCVPADIENFAQLIVAQNEGEYAKENLTVNIENDPGGSAAEPQELAQGTCQFVETGISAGTINAIGQGIPLVYVATPQFPNPTDQAGYWINKSFLNADGTTFNKSMVSSCTVMPGGSGVGSPPSAQLQIWLQAQGLGLSQFRTETLSASATIQAMQSGALCIADLSSPFWKLLSTDTAVEPFLTPNWPSGIIEVYKPWATSHKLVTEAFLRALIRTDRTYLRLGYRNNATIMNQISAWLNIPVATIVQTKPIYFSTTFGTSVTNTAITKIEAGFISIGTVLSFTTPIPASKMIDSSFVADIMKHG